MMMRNSRTGVTGSLWQNNAMESRSGKVFLAEGAGCALGVWWWYGAQLES